MFKKSFLFLVLGMTSNLMFAAETPGTIKKTLCERDFLQNEYLDLVASERSVGEAFKKTVNVAGTNKLSHCIYEFTHREGNPVPGPRRVSLDTEWFETRHENGIPIRVPQQHGIRIEYVLTGGQTPTKNIQSITICRNPETCKKLGIPFGNDETSVTPVPVPPGGEGRRDEIGN